MGFEFLCLQETHSEMERLQPQINLILEAGERQVEQIQNTDPEKAQRIRTKMEQLKVRVTRREMGQSDLQLSLIWISRGAGVGAGCSDTKWVILDQTYLIFECI